MRDVVRRWPPIELSPPSSSAAGPELSVETRRLLYAFRGHTGLGGNRIQCEGRQAGEQLVPALSALVDEVHVSQTGVDDGAQQATEQHGVGAGVRPQPGARVAREFDLTRVDDDELLRTGADSALDRHTDDVLLLGEVRADDHDGGGVRQFPGGHRSREVAKHVLQPLDDAGAVVRRDVHAVRAHDSTGELLRRVQFLIRVAGVRHEREGGAAMRREALGGSGDRLFPRGFL